MKKLTRIVLALALIPYLIPMAQAGSTILGNIVNVGQLGGVAVATGSGSSNTGTQRVILASDSPLGAISLSAGTNNIGTVSGSTVTEAGVYNSSPPTLTNGATAPIQLDVNGNQKVNIAVALPAGTALIGKVGIDQTTPGTTNGVQVNAALPAGTNLMGKVGIDQTTPGTTNRVDATIAAAQTLATVTTVGAVTAITNALPAGTNTIGAVTFPAVSAPTISKVGATTSSAQLIASNATRKGLEIDCDCSNTDNVAINFGASAAVYANHKILTPCANYQPPPGVNVTSAIQIISNSGTQNCRVIEYP